MIATLTVDSNTWRIDGLCHSPFTATIKEAIKTKQHSRTPDLLSDGFTIAYDNVTELSDPRITPKYFMEHVQSVKTWNPGVLWICLCVLFDDGEACSISLHSSNRNILWDETEMNVPASSIGIRSFNPTLNDNDIIQLKLLALEI